MYPRNPFGGLLLFFGSMYEARLHAVIVFKKNCCPVVHMRIASSVVIGSF